MRICILPQLFYRRNGHNTETKMLLEHLRLKMSRCVLYANGYSALLKTRNLIVRCAVYSLLRITEIC